MEEGDKLIGVEVTDGRCEILLGTKEGIVIRFREENVRSMGRTARGVRGISLDETNQVIGMTTITSGTEASILTVTEGGFGKRTLATEYRTQGRGGKGVISVRVTEKNGQAVSFHRVSDNDEIMVMTAEGKILRTKTASFRDIGRNSQGVRLIDMENTDRVVGVAKLAESVDEENNEEKSAVEILETNGSA